MAEPRRLDPRFGRHLRAFAGQVAFLVLIGSPALLIDAHPPILFLRVLRGLFSLTALWLLAVGLLTKRRTPPGKSFDLWDHCLAFTLLQLGCSIALRLIG